MNSPLIQRSMHNLSKTASAERQIAVQHLIAFLLYATLAGGVALAGFLWSDVVVLNKLTVGSIASSFVYLPLILTAADLCTAVYHFALFRKLRHENPDEYLAPVHIWAEGTTGERSPLKVTLVFIGMAALILVLSLLTTPSPAKVPVVGIDGIEFSFDMNMRELYDLGLVLKDRDGAVLVLEEWSVDKKTAISGGYTLALAGSDAETTVNVFLYNPTSKTVDLSGVYIRQLSCRLSENSSAEVPITVSGVDYRGMSTPAAMSAVAAIGGLTLDEDAYRKRPSRCKFSNGPYSYTLNFGGSTFNYISDIVITRYVQVKS